MKTNGIVFNTKRMPEKWRRQFKIYRAKISIYLDTTDFGTPLMVDASEMMEFLPAGIDDPSFVERTGPVRPGAEALWVEAEVPEGLVSRPSTLRIGAMVHRSKTRTNFMKEPFTGAEHEYWIESYLRDSDGLSTRLEHDVRFRLDDRGFLTGLEFMKNGYQLRPGNPFLDGVKGMIPSDYDAQDPPAALAVEAINRVFFALALMNCKNVTLRERGSGKAAGAGPTDDAFHEVVIDGKTRGSAGAGNEAGAIWPAATSRRSLKRRRCWVGMSELTGGAGRSAARRAQVPLRRPTH